MKLVPIMTSWGLFTGPEFLVFYIPDSGETMPSKKQQEILIEVARQEAEIYEWRKSGGQLSSITSYGSSFACGCCNHPRSR